MRPAMQTTGSSEALLVTVEIGGARLGLSSDDGRQRLRVSGPMGAFRVLRRTSRPHIRATVRRGGIPQARERDLVFASGSLWQLFRDGDGYLFRFSSPALGSEPYKIARFDRAFSRGEIVVNARYPGYFPAASGGLDALEYPLDELLFVHWLAGGRGIEVHAAGLLGPDGRGYLFVGHSGAGKSTIARLWRARTGAVVLSDDRIIVRERRGRPWIHGTPWHGEAALSARAAAPLAGIFFLHKGPAPRLVELGAAQAASRLVSTCFLPHHSAEGLHFAVDLAARVVARVPCRELWFAPEPGVVDFVVASARGKR